MCCLYLQKLSEFYAVFTDFSLGWWFISLVRTGEQGYAPGAYLNPVNKNIPGNSEDIVIGEKTQMMRKYHW